MLSLAVVGPGRFDRARAASRSLQLRRMPWLAAVITVPHEVPPGTVPRSPQCCHRGKREKTAGRRKKEEELRKKEAGRDIEEESRSRSKLGATELSFTFFSRPAWGQNSHLQAEAERPDRSLIYMQWLTLCQDC